MDVQVLPLALVCGQLHTEETCQLADNVASRVVLTSKLLIEPDGSFVPRLKVLFTSGYAEPAIPTARSIAERFGWALLLE